MASREVGRAEGKIVNGAESVHSMGSNGDFEEMDRESARIFAQAAVDADARRFIHLGGLGDEQDQLSPHLRSPLPPTWR